MVLGKQDYKLGSLDQSGSKDVVALVARTPSAIGYSGMGYATPEVKMLKVSKHKGEPGVAPTVANAKNGTYPITRSLQIYTVGDPAGRIKAYLDWILSPGRAERSCSIRVTCRCLPARRQSHDPSRCVPQHSRPRPVRGFPAAGHGRGPRRAGRRVDYPPVRLELHPVRAGHFLLRNPRGDGRAAGRTGLVEFFTSVQWQPTSAVQPRFGILALLAGTAAVTGLAMLIAVPLGLGAAVYVSEFATGAWKETLKVVIELLAAVPSVVWGFVGLMVLGPLIIRLTGAPVGINLLNGGIILALMSVPIIVSVGEDALKAVPDSYREAALALGASRWEIVYRVLFPAARNGLLAAVLLGVGRGIGETMAVLMATGNAVQIPHSLLDPVRTLTATIAAELGEAGQGGTHFRVLFRHRPGAVR